MIGYRKDSVLPEPVPVADRKSTRLNSSHRCISYAVFCLKKKKRTEHHVGFGTEERRGRRRTAAKRSGVRPDQARVPAGLQNARTRAAGSEVPPQLDAALG